MKRGKRKEGRGGKAGERQLERGRRGDDGKCVEEDKREKFTADIRMRDGER